LYYYRISQKPQIKVYIESTITLFIISVFIKEKIVYKKQINNKCEAQPTDF